MDSVRTWFRSGMPWVWLNAAAVSVSILLVVGLLALIGVYNRREALSKPGGVAASTLEAVLRAIADRDTSRFGETLLDDARALDRLRRAAAEPSDDDV